MTYQGKKILVVGGGISGLTAAIETAEAGHEVILIEHNPYLGGRVAQFRHYFPKLCPPYCGLEINFKRIKRNPLIKVFTLSEVLSIEGETGNYNVVVKQKPRFVNERCTVCGKCSDVATTTIKNPFNYGMDEIKAVYLPHDLSYPNRYVIDASIVNTEEGKIVVDACPYDAIDLKDTEKEISFEVAAIVWATGWQPYDPLKLVNYNFGSSPDILTNVQFERLASDTGPTGGKIVKSSNGEVPKSVAFIQCAGSRDENHLPFCSTVCCLASLKQSTYVRKQYPETTVTIYFIDIRAMARNEDFYSKIKEDQGVNFVKSKIARIETEAGKLILEGEDTLLGKKFKAEHDLVVLATGMQPSTVENKIPFNVDYDDYGFPISDSSGIIACGSVRSPMEVANSTQDATAAALKAIQISVGR